MQKNFLRRLNFAIFLLIVVIAATLQSTIFKYFPLNYFQPDFVLLLAIYFGFKRDNIEGGLFVALAALILEAHSSAYRSFYLTGYLYAFVVTKIFSRIIVVPNRVTVTLFSMVLTVVWKIGMLILLGLADRAGNGVKHMLIYLVPGVLAQGLAASILLHWFSQIDLWTHKDAHSEDEYDINKEF